MKNKDVERAISHLEIGRKTCLKLIANVPHEQLVKIPQGFNNSIMWNVAHLLVTQQLLNYKLSGLPLHISDKLVSDFGKGSAARNDYSVESWQDILLLFLEMPRKLKSDYESGLFKNFKEYPTSFGVTLNTIEDSIAFNGIHEGLHIGYIMALKRAL
ncbi:MAG: DinB family protein [Crocinitomicaceae bacterium]